MDLVRDTLDARLVDREGQGLGRVDGILLRLRPGRPPRVVAVEVGAVTLARRIGPRTARVVRWLTRAFAPVRTHAVRYPPRLFRDVGVDIELDVAASEEARLLPLEKWLRRHVVAKLPGGKP